MDSPSLGCIVVAREKLLGTRTTEGRLAMNDWFEGLVISTSSSSVMTMDRIYYRDPRGEEKAERRDENS